MRATGPTASLTSPLYGRTRSAGNPSPFGPAGWFRAMKALRSQGVPREAGTPVAGEGARTGGLHEHYSARRRQRCRSGHLPAHPQGRRQRRPRAARGEEVFGAVARVRPHVVVLDVNLPDTDGHDICRRLRADRYSSGIPVLMLTVRDRREDVLAGLNAGADDYVAKDEAGEVILARVDRLANYRKLADARRAERAARPGRAAARGHRARDPLAALGHPRPRRADADHPRRRPECTRVPRADPPELLRPPVPPRTPYGGGADRSNVAGVDQHRPRGPRGGRSLLKGDRPAWPSPRVGRRGPRRTSAGGRRSGPADPGPAQPAGQRP